jgi:hypothetical protein
MKPATISSEALDPGSGSRPFCAFILLFVSTTRRTRRARRSIAPRHERTVESGAKLAPSGTGRVRALAELVCCCPTGYRTGTEPDAGATLVGSGNNDRRRSRPCLRLARV